MQNTIHLDTTKLTPQALSNQVRAYFTSESDKPFSVTFQSFGFKHGVPMDADEIIDVRFLPNPFYEPALRSKTGNDKDVYDYVMSREETVDFTQRLKTIWTLYCAPTRNSRKIIRLSALAVRVTASLRFYCQLAV